MLKRDYLPNSGLIRPWQVPEELKGTVKERADSPTEEETEFPLLHLKSHS